MKIIFFSISIVFLFLINPVQAWSESDTPFSVMTIGGYSDPGVLNFPLGIAIDDSNNIYIADNFNHRIQKFDNNGQFLLTFGTYGSGDGQIKNPSDVEVDNNGNLYVADSGNNRIQKFTNDGSFLMKFGTFGSGDGQLNYPGGLKIDAGGSIFVSDQMNHRIQKFDSDGNFLLKFGSFGTANGQLRYPKKIALDSSGNIFVVDYFNHRVQKFDPNGTYLSKFGSNGSGDGQFYYPMGIVISEAGNIYIADYENHRIQEFNSAGVFLSKFGSLGSGNNQFNRPSDLDFNEDGELSISDTSNGRIMRFTIAGGYLNQFGGSFVQDGKFISPRGVYVDIQGNIFVADTYNHRIQKFASDGSFLMKFGSLGSGDGQLNAPEDIRVDSSGNIYVVDTDNHRIQKFDSDGNFLSKFGNYGTADGQFNYPSKIIFDSLGNIFVVDTYNHRVQKFSSNGTFLMKFGSNGNGDGQLSYPRGIVFDNVGNIYIADYFNNRIQKFDSNGNYLMKFGSVGTGDGQFQYPAGIALDSAGNIFVSDYRNYRIQKFTNTGVFITKFGEFGISSGQFQSQYAICFDTSGSLFVVELDNSRVQKFTFDRTSPQGNISTLTGANFINSRLIQFDTTATDDLSGVISMRLSEDPLFTGSDWQAYSAISPFTLTEGDGLKSVYIQFLDNRSNYSPVYSTSITLDTVSPSKVELLSIGLVGSIPIQDTISYFFYAPKLLITGKGEPNAIVSFISSEILYTSIVGLDGRFSFWTEGPSLNDGWNELRYYQTDQAGNVSASRLLRIDVTEPYTIFDNTGPINSEVVEMLEGTDNIPLITPTVIRMLSSLTPIPEPVSDNTGNPETKGMATAISAIGLAVMFTPSLIVGTLLLPKFLAFGFFWLLPSKKTKPWGLVYDIYSRIPIPFTIVRIYSLEGTLQKETISDLQGRYDFVLDAGSYRLEVNNGGYEKFEKKIIIAGDDKQFIQDIGLERKGYEGIFNAKTIDSLKELIKGMIWLVGLAGICISIYAFLTNPILINLLILIGYIIQLSLFLLLKVPRNWGVVYDAATGLGLKGVFVRLHDRISGKQIEVQISDNKGRFGFRMDKGEYLLEFDYLGKVIKNYQGSKVMLHTQREAVQIGNQGIGNIKIGLG